MLKIIILSPCFVNRIYFFSKMLIFCKKIFDKNYFLKFTFFNLKNLNNLIIFKAMFSNGRHFLRFALTSRYIPSCSMYLNPHLEEFKKKRSEVSPDFYKQVIFFWILNQKLKHVLTTVK